MKKRFLALLLTVVTVLAFSINAFAATGVSAGEQSLLDFGKSKAEKYDVADTKLFKAYYDEVSRYLAANKTDLSDDAVKKLLDLANVEAGKIEKVLAEYNTTSLTVLHKQHPQVWEDLWNEVRNDITPEVLQFGVIVSADVKEHLFTLSDKDGNPISGGDDPIHWTGETSSRVPVAATVSVLAAAVAGCLFVAYKKKIIGSKEA
ncbi:MAG: hypothetical protein IJM37_02785 [Lachnospiraceae bacterium]|nr:hypothetical protein [Lachnospiraceae bacterium]